MRHEIHNDPTTVSHLCTYAQSRTEQNGGREWINRIDGVKQYPCSDNMQPIKPYMAMNYAPTHLN